MIGGCGLGEVGIHTPSNLIVFSSRVQICIACDSHPVYNMTMKKGEKMIFNSLPKGGCHKCTYMYTILMEYKQVNIM